VHAIVLIIHISGGTAAILAGFAALAYRKGGRRHALAGNIFFGSMIVMVTMGAALALAKNDLGTASAALLAGYLFATGWATARNRTATAGPFERIALAAALASTAVFSLFGFWAATSPTGNFSGYQPVLYFVWAVLFALAAGLDLNFILRGTLSPVQRLRRHLWRMCTALFIASGSFFLGQQKVMPFWMKGSALLWIPALAPLALMLFWLVRVSWARRWRPRAPRPTLTLEAAE
jgi:hypothetical protein